MNSIISNNTINFIKKVYNRPSIINNPTCYVYDLSIIKNNVELLESFAPSQISLYYAMKANSNKKIMECVRKLKFIRGIEIASSGELSKARQFFDGNEILFTGPGKTEKELELAIKNKIRSINVESVVEAIRINNIAEKLGIDKVNILLRINTNYYIDDAYENMAGKSTKMGIDEDKYIDSFKIINALPRVNVRGVHIFSASGVLDYKSLIKYARYVFNLVKNIENKTHKIDIIDFGGGLGIDYSNEDRLFDIKNYFNDLSLLIKEFSFEDKEIIMELGTFIVGNAGYYTAKIIDIKENKGRKHIIIAGGVNHMGLPLEMHRKHPVHIIPMNVPKLYEGQNSVNNEQADISGPLCMSSDKLSWDDYINEANIGDIVVYRQAGAYCYSEAMVNFLSHPYPKEIFLPSEKKTNVTNI
jgi:diaminopimelate decarboxylase